MPEERDVRLERLITLAMDCLGVAVTIIDTKGTLLYYNKQAARILPRKPEYIGKDVYSHHKKASSTQKLHSMIRDFQDGRREPFRYEAKPYGKTILVTLSPILDGDTLIGCAQSVQLEEDLDISGVYVSVKEPLDVP